MSWTDRIAAMVAGLGLGSRRPRGPLILMYHGIGGSDGVPADLFRAQLDLLASQWRIVPLREAVSLLGSDQLSNVVSLTFDDGYRDFAELALPALVDRGLHATLFVPARHMGGTNAWDEGLAPRRPILDAASLRALDPAHVEIAAHGNSHCRLRGLTEARLQEETRGARSILEDRCGRAISLFAYPYGLADDFDRAAERAVEAAGFAAACSTRFGRGSSAQERYRLRRVGIEPSDGMQRFQGKLDGAYDWLAWKEGVGLRLRTVGLRRRPSP